MRRSLVGDRRRHQVLRVVAQVLGLVVVELGGRADLDLAERLVVEHADVDLAPLDVLLEEHHAVALLGGVERGVAAAPDP